MGALPSEKFRDAFHLVYGCKSWFWSWSLKWCVQDKMPLSFSLKVSFKVVLEEVVKKTSSVHFKAVL